MNALTDRLQRDETQCESPQTIRFTVAGIPKPAGSKRAFYIQKLKRAIITDACKSSGDWKHDVKQAAMNVAMPDGCAFLSDPLSLTVEFVMPRPKSHYRKNGELKPTAPQWHTNKPDATKLLRCVEDCLTGIIWNDDAQVVMEHATKRYGRQPGVTVTVTRIEQ